MNEDWLKDIQHKMSDFETDEPQGLWDDIYAQNLKVKDEKSHSFGISNWKRIVSVAAMLAIIVSVCLFLYKDNTLEVNDIYHKTSESVAENITMSNNASTSSSCPEQSILIPVQSAYTNNIIPVNSYSETSLTLNSSTTFKKNDNETIPSSDTVKIKRLEEAPLYSHKNYNRDLIAVNVSKGNRDSRVSIGIFSTGGTGSELNRKSMGMTTIAGVGPEFCDWIDSPLLGIMTFNRGLEVKDDIKHHLPIKTGLSFTYKLNDRFGIESGLAYTNLSSDIFQGSESHYLKGKQTLHYIGIPLNLKINLFSWKNIDLYASAGAMGEKCVAGDLKEKYVVNNVTTKRENNSIEEKPFQWSVNAAAGFQFNFSSLVGLYVEPGVSYYFDDGSPLKTIYKEKPLNFNLNLGVRLSL